MENYKSKFTLAELERIQFQSQIALLEQRAENSKPTQVEGQAGLTGGNLLQDMMDNFRELAETHLQCVVCSERAKLKAETVRPRNNREVFSDTSYSSSSSSSSTSAEKMNPLS